MTFEKYERAEMEIIEFEAEDVITMSGANVYVGFEGEDSPL